MLYLAGLADAATSAPDVMVDGYAYGSLSMKSYTLDAPPVPEPAAAGGGADVPDDVPATETNL